MLITKKLLQELQEPLSGSVYYKNLLVNGSNDEHTDLLFFVLTCIMHHFVLLYLFRFWEELL